MLDEIAEHLEDFRRQPDALTRSLQGLELRVQGTIGKAVDHTSSAEQWQIATETCGEIEQYGHVVPRTSTRSSGRSSFFYSKFGPRSWRRPPLAASGPRHSTSAPQARGVHGLHRDAEKSQGAETGSEAPALTSRFSHERSRTRIHAPGRPHIGRAAYVVWALPLMSDELPKGPDKKWDSA